MSVPAEHRAPTFLEKLRRASDRLVTPNVIIALIVVVGAVVVYSVHAAVQAELHGGRGLVVIETVTKTLTAFGSLVSAGLLFVSRFQLSRIEVAAAAAAAAPTTGGEPAPRAEGERAAAEPTVAPTTDTPVESPEPVVEPLEPVVTPVEPPARVEEPTGLIPVVRHRA